MPVLSVLCGIQASGKSTFFERRLSADHELVSKDLMGGRSSTKEERTLCAVHEALASGRNVAVDNTNVDAASRERLVLVARMCGADVHCYFFPPRLDDCLRRNEAREGKKKVPVAALFRFHASLSPPDWREGYDRMFEVEIGREGGFLMSERLRR